MEDEGVRRPVRQTAQGLKDLLRKAERRTEGRLNGRPTEGRWRGTGGLAASGTRRRACRECIRIRSGA